SREWRNIDAKTVARKIGSKAVAAPQYTIDNWLAEGLDRPRQLSVTDSAGVRVPGLTTKTNGMPSLHPSVTRDLHGLSVDNASTISRCCSSMASPLNTSGGWPGRSIQHTTQTVGLPAY
ncbi:MAG: hypothetical protein ABIH23_26235, partial [bacterium]